MQVSNGFLVYQEFNPKTKRDIWILPVEALLTDAFGRAFSPTLAWEAVDGLYVRHLRTA
jgi:hypothetical protein